MGRGRGCRRWKVSHEDDTAIATDSVAHEEPVLQTIELSVVHDGLRLQRSRCEAIAIGEAGSDTTFGNGALVAQPAAAKYLRCRIYLYQAVTAGVFPERCMTRPRIFPGRRFSLAGQHAEVDTLLAPSGRMPSAAAGST